MTCSIAMEYGQGYYTLIQNNMNQCYEDQLCILANPYKHENIQSCAL